MRAAAATAAAAEAEADEKITVNRRPAGSARTSVYAMSSIYLALQFWLNSAFGTFRCIGTHWMTGTMDCSMQHNVESNMITTPVH